MRICEVDADGNCLYRALDDQCNNRYGHDTIRAHVADYIESHASDFAPYAVGEDAVASVSSGESDKADDDDDDDDDKEEEEEEEEEGQHQQERRRNNNFSKKRNQEDEKTHQGGTRAAPRTGVVRPEAQGGWYVGRQPRGGCSCKATSKAHRHTPGGWTDV